MKNPQLFQIGEVAHLLGISRKMILDYERHGLIKPTYVDKYSNYRYFDTICISKLSLILHLRKANMSIKDILKYFNSEITFDCQISTLKDKIANLEKAIENLSRRNVKDNSTLKIIQTTLDESHCICKEVTAKNFKDGINIFIQTYIEIAKKNYQIDINNNNFCIFPKNILSEDLYDTKNIAMKICIPLEKTNENSDKLEYFPPTKAIAISYNGSFYNELSAYKSLKDYLIKNNLTPNGYPREYYLQSNFDESHKNNIIFIAIPIK